MKKYGLQLRAPPSQKKQPTRPPLPPPPGFQDDDEDDVEREIARQASKSKVLKDIEEQHKKALEDDPSIFDYDGVYDEMKEKMVRPLVQDRQERKPRYIQALIDKAKVREREHEIIYERKLAKERSKEDHLFADKDKFVTGAYKKKLAEQQKWMEEERLRQLREEKDDVTKKSDMSDFYFNLQKNVAFGATVAEPKMPAKKEEKPIPDTSKKEDFTKNEHPSSPDENYGEYKKNEFSEEKEKERDEGESYNNSNETISRQETVITEGEETKSDHHKRSQDALAAAKERFLARKKAKEQ